MGNTRKEGGNPVEGDQNWKNVGGALIQSAFTLEVYLYIYFLKSNSRLT